MPKRKGLIIVHTGTGKGKTTAGLGMALRATGHKFRVLMIQFIKGSLNSGEIKAASRLHPFFDIVPMGKGFIGLKNKTADPEDQKAVASAWRFAEKRIASGEFDMIILDEINYAIDYKLLLVEDILKVLARKPDSLHLVLTGRNAHPRIIELADLVTEMREIKHPFQKGIKAQKGIEF